MDDEMERECRERPSDCKAIGGRITSGRITSGMMSSNTGEWETPQDLFDRLNEEFHFTLDVCATEENTKCEVFYNEEADGLALPWSGVVWENPPYGRDIGKWMKKAREYGEQGGIAVCLVPARTDTKWWHENCMCASEIRFIEGRLKFGKAQNSAPFPSAVVVFGMGKYPRMTAMKAKED